MPLISICIPTYNRYRLLKQVLENYTKKDCFLNTNDIEIIISDNCSTDKTPELCQKYAEKFPDKIKYIQREIPVVADYNIWGTIEFATGEYIKLNNDTIFFEDGELEQVIEHVKKQKLDDCVFIYNNQQEHKIIQYNNIDTFIKNISFNFTWIGGFLIKREVFNSLRDNIRFIDYNLPQSDIILRLLSQNNSISVIEGKIIHCLTVANKGGNYNIAEAFGKNYLSLLKEYLKNDQLSKKTYHKEKKNILKFINKYYIDKKNEYNFNKTGYFKYLFEDYKYCPYFYTKYILAHIKKRFIKDFH